MANINSKANSRKSSKRVSKKYVSKPRNKSSHPAYRTHSKQTSKTSKDLYETLTSIETQLKKQNSFWRNFAMALVKGLGNAIGATIIFGALLMWARNRLTPYIQEIQNYLQERVIIKPLQEE